MFKINWHRAVVVTMLILQVVPRAMTAPVYLVDGSPLRDPLFTAVISERMRVPDRLQVTQAAVEDLKARTEDVPPAFSMHVPDRLALTGEETAAHEPS